MHSRQTGRAFTLVEMLLVVAVIVLLIAMLLPSLRASRDAARRTQCAANLGQWGVAVVTYATDNSGRLLRTPRPHGNRPHPMIAWGRHDVSAAAKGGVPTNEFAASLINPYVGTAVDLVNKNVPRSSMWICPSGVGNGVVPEAFINAAPLKVWDALGYFHYSYQYFAGVGPEATHPDELPGLRIKSGTQTLMTDEIWKQKGFNAWQYGHGSPSNHRTVTGVSVPVLATPHSLEGINKLLGDGSVSWKDASEFDLGMMGAAPGTPTAKNHWVDNSIVAVPY